MFHLRTCAAKLRPLTASQTVKTFSQNRPAAARTFGQIRCYTAPVAAEPFLSGTSSNYVEEMYYAWLENPKSVHKVRLRGAGVFVCLESWPMVAGHPGKCMCSEDRREGMQAGGWKPHRPEFSASAQLGRHTRPNWNRLLWRGVSLSSCAARSRPCSLEQPTC